MKVKIKMTNKKTYTATFGECDTMEEVSKWINGCEGHSINIGNKHVLNLSHIVSITKIED